MPAVVVGSAQAGFVLVKFEHGVTCRVAMSDLEPRDPSSGAVDRPVSGYRFRDEPRRKSSRPYSPRVKFPADRDQ